MISQEAAIYESATRYFEAIRTRSNPVVHATGKVALRDELWRNLSHESREKEVDVRIQHLAVTRIDGDKALVDAIIKHEWIESSNLWGRRHIQEIITGPIKMLCVLGEWKVADYFTDGKSVDRSFSCVVPRDEELHRLQVLPLAVEFGSDLTLLFFQVNNRSAEAIRFGRAALKLSSWRWKTGHVGDGAEKAEPGERLLLAASWQKELPRTLRELRISLSVKPHRAAKFNFDLAIPLKEESRKEEAAGK